MRYLLILPILAWGAVISVAQAEKSEPRTATGVKTDTTTGTAAKNAAQGANPTFEDSAYGRKTESMSPHARKQSKENRKLTDGEIVHYLKTANEMDVAAAKLASEKAESAEVKAYAKKMLNDHTSANQQIARIVQDQKVKSGTHPASEELRNEYQAALKDMQNLKGKEFELAYIGHERAMHQKVLDTMDRQLLPNVSNAQLRDQLRKTRPVLQAHLQHAQQMHSAPAAERHDHKGDVSEPAE